MAKISSFPKDTELDGEEIIPVVSDGENKHLTLNQIKEHIGGSLPPVDLEETKQEILSLVNGVVDETMELANRIDYLMRDIASVRDLYADLERRHMGFASLFQGLNENPWPSVLSRIQALEEKSIIIEEPTT